MPNSFIQNVNTLASKIPIIESANSIFDEGVIPVLQEIALLDLDAAVLDLKKGTFLGNRKLDFNLALNMVGITEDLLTSNPIAAEAIWTDPTKTVQYSSATATFTDGTVIPLPFIFDGAPATVSTHGDLLAQLSRLDYVTAIAQVDTINTFVAANTTSYIVTINGVPITYVSDADATVAEIVAGLVTAINLDAVPVTAASILTGTAISLTADVAGTAFNAYVNANMAITTTTANRAAGPVQTAFLAKLNNTLLASFASDVVGEIVRAYDVIGQNSNLERIQLHVASGSAIDLNPVYYWGKTTSAFQTLSMRAGEIIKLGNDIDSIIVLATRINELVALITYLPQLITNADSLTSNMAKLVTLHTNITALVNIHTNMTKLQNIDTNMLALTTIDTNMSNLVSIANTIVPSMAEILLADTNAATATTQAALATTKSNEIKNVSVGSTLTVVAGTPASVVYNPLDGKFTFAIPQGPTGERGDSFTVNSVGLFSERSLYDASVKGFSFLALDTSTIYFKLSNTTADWSAGSPFGKGDIGATGATGVGILSTVFFSTTDISGLAGKSGATDTYRITYSNSTTSDFLVYNGLNSAVLSVAGKTGTVVLVKGDVGLGNVDNTSDVNKPVSTAQATALGLKADQATTYTKTEVDGLIPIDEKVAHLSITASTYNADGTLATMTYTGGYKTLYTYTTGNLTKVEYTDTDGTTVLLTETIGYTNGNLTSVTRS